MTKDDRAAALGSCPCSYVTPCHERCSCVMLVSSSGCRRCCSYGSYEQRKAAAVALLAAEAERERLAALVNEVERDINSVEQYRAARVRGGQHVGVGGALGNATPSALIYLRRLVRDMRAVIGKATTDTERHDG